MFIFFYQNRVDFLIKTSIFSLSIINSFFIRVVIISFFTLKITTQYIFKRQQQNKENTSNT
jgi:hypothetical protein